MCLVSPTGICMTKTTCTFVLQIISLLGSNLTWLQICGCFVIKAWNRSHNPINSQWWNWCRAPNDYWVNKSKAPLRTEHVILQGNYAANWKFVCNNNVRCSRFILIWCKLQPLMIKNAYKVNLFSIKVVPRVIHLHYSLQRLGVIIAFETLYH